MGLTLGALARSEFARILLNVVLEVVLEIALEVVLDFFVVFVCDFVAMQSVAFAVTVTVETDMVFDVHVVVLDGVVVGSSEASTTYTAVEHSGHRYPVGTLYVSLASKPAGAAATGATSMRERITAIETIRMRPGDEREPLDDRIVLLGVLDDGCERRWKSRY